MNFKSLQKGSNTSLLIKIGIITVNTFLPVSNKFYSCSLKIHALARGFVAWMNIGCVSGLTFGWKSLIFIEHFFSDFPVIPDNSTYQFFLE